MLWRWVWSMLGTVDSKQHNVRVSTIYGETPTSTLEHHFGLHSHNNLTARKRSKENVSAKFTLSCKSYKLSLRADR